MRFFPWLGFLFLCGNFFVHAAAPPNDAPDKAGVLESPLPLTLTGNLSGVTEDRRPTGEPYITHPETMRPASVVWYRWTPSVSELVEVTVSSDTFPPANEIPDYARANVWLFGGNDISTAPFVDGEGLRWVKAGQTYWLAIGSFFDWDSPVPADAPFQLKLTRVIPPADIESLSIQPGTVDVSENAAVVMVSGVLRHEVTVMSGQEFTLCGSWPGRENTHRTVALTPLGEGRYSFSSQVTIPRGSLPGNYHFDCELTGELPNSNGSVSFKFRDGGGAIANPYYAEMPLPEVASVPLIVRNVGSIDFTPPTLSLGSLRPAVVDADGKAGLLEFEARIDDDASGFDPDHPGNYVSLESYGRALGFGKTMQHLSGNDRQGRWRWTLPLPANLPGGSYRLSLRLFDRMGHRAVYSDSNFGDGQSFAWPPGLPRTIEVRGSRGYQAWCFWNAQPRPDGSVPLNGPLFTPEGLPVVSSDTGLPNLFTYAFNMRSDFSSPGDTARMPQYLLDPSNGGRLTIRFYRLRSNGDGWPLGLNYRAQFAGNPAGPWQDAPESSQRVEFQGPEFEIITVPDPAPFGGSRFGRMKIEYNEP
ncbi:MAG: hypothetical protein JWL81_1401 [Verrucomicrobiales bacterium]|nr:hypothetical protein [Verrucomicrobiales bacterium]